MVSILLDSQSLLELCQNQKERPPGDPGGRLHLSSQSQIKDLWTVVVSLRLAATTTSYETTEAENSHSGWSWDAVYNDAC